MLQVAKSSFVPVLFGHALDDDFIRPHHSDRIYEAYVVSFQFLIAILLLTHVHLRLASMGFGINIWLMFMMVG